MTRFLSLSELALGEIESLLSVAKDFEASPISSHLKDKVIGLLFMNPSLRTLASFQTGIAQMGGTSVVIQPGQGTWSLERQDGAVMDGVNPEHVRDAIPVMARYFDALGVRCFATGTSLDEDLEDSLVPKMAELFAGPFFNMESANDHPCQALADWKTLDDLSVPRNGKFVLSWAWHPKPLPFAVPNAVLRMAIQRGMDVTVCNPEGFDLPQEVTKGATVTHDRFVAMKDADAVYVKSWSSATHYGQLSESEQRAPLRDWCAEESWLSPASKSAPLMHCLPVRRNVEVGDGLLDGPRSAVLAQAENRLHVQKAVLAALMGAAR